MSHRNVGPRRRDIRRILLYPHAPTFFGEACKVTRYTKILGLIVDDKRNFNEHLQQVERKVAKQLNIFKKFCGSNWGLRQATLIKLYKTLVLPRLLYAAPVWARKHVQALSRFQYTALKLIIGTSTKFDQLAAEILCGLPPMQLQIDIITIKFGIKLSQQQDILWELYRKCQLPEIKSHKNLIDDFYKSSETGVITPGFNVRPLEQVVSKTVRQSARSEHRDINKRNERETQGNNTRTG